jgi:hypothetical protein
MGKFIADFDERESKKFASPPHGLTMGPRVC